MSAQTKNKELNALISMLDEPDDSVFTEVKDRIYSFGNLALSELEVAWADLKSPLARQRAESLIRLIQRDELYLDLISWKNFSEHDLLEGAYLAAKFHYPDISKKTIRNELLAIAGHIRMEMNQSLTDLNKIRVFNHVLYRVHGFSGNRKYLNAPENMFLNKVMESRKGNPISLALIYLILGRMLELRVYGINLPHHFVLAFVQQKEEEREWKRSDVLFYINPFAEGTIFIADEISRYLNEIDIKQKERFYLPVKDTVVIHRLLKDMQISFNKDGQKGRADELERYLDIFR